jgi:uncharacterized protein (DUF1800 family)
MLKPLAAADWNSSTAAHLLCRAGFGGPPSEIEKLRGLGLDGAVDFLLEIREESELAATPDFDLRFGMLQIAAAAEPPWLGVTPDPESVLRVARMKDGEIENGVRSWWLRRKILTPNPLREKMTLFWHGHFATSNRKVNAPFLMWVQNATLRSHALANFGLMTKAISRDPAMMIFLDLERSDKKHPNENFARELMELFTLGIGNYTEEDIQQAARAFTGYRLDPARNFKFVARDHDEGQKHFMGWLSNYDGDEIIDRIIARPACAKFICLKWWRFFADEELPDGDTIEQLATIFRDNNFELKPVLRALFRSSRFYSAAAMCRQIKSPVQWFVQTARSLELDPPTGEPVQAFLRQMGQTLLAPPSVKGWDGGRNWISTQTLLLRYNSAEIFVRDRKKNAQGLNVQAISPFERRADPDVLVDDLAARLFLQPLDPLLRRAFLDYLEPHRSRPDDQTVRGLLQLMMSTPQFQVC